MSENERVARDINVLMREGHPFIAEVEELCIRLVEQHRTPTRRPIRLLEIGCASGHHLANPRTASADATITAHEEFAPFAALARERLHGTGVALHCGPLEALQGRFDVLLSAGAHHHLPSHYLDEARRMLQDDGAFVLADEFCPEYCTPDELRQIASATQIYLANGYVLTSQYEVDAYLAERALPQRAHEMEARRRQALWHWYRFVVDEAMRGGYIEVAVAELQSAHDDLVTGEEAEHKLSPSIVERQLSLSRFRLLHKHVLGPAGDPSMHSIIAYELGGAGVGSTPHC